MDFFRKLFGGASQYVSTATASIPIRSPKHPAHALALEADASDGQKRLEMIEKALALDPRNADLLYAKASTLCGAETGCFNEDKLGDEAKRAITELGRLHPDHFDTRMMRRKFGYARPLSGNWESLFYFNSWTEGSEQLGGLMLSRVTQERYVQIVRHCLVPSIAVVYYIDKTVCDKINRIRWDVRWAQTPHGAIAVHYLIMDLGKNELSRNEAFLPHGVSNPPSAQDGYCLLRRLTQVDHCFLVLSDGRGQVLRNELFEFPPSMKHALLNIKRQLHKSGPCNPRELISKAGKWYMNHTDINSITF